MVTDLRFPKYPAVPVIVGSDYQWMGLGDENVSGSEHYGKRGAADDDAPEYAGALFLDCGFKHYDCSLVLVDERNRVFVRRLFLFSGGIGLIDYGVGKSSSVKRGGRGLE